MASKIQSDAEGSGQASVMPGAGSTPRGRLELVGKIESYDDTVNMAVIIPREDGIICVSDDRCPSLSPPYSSHAHYRALCYSSLPPSAHVPVSNCSFLTV